MAPNKIFSDEMLENLTRIWFNKFRSIEPNFYLADTESVIHQMNVLLRRNQNRFIPISDHIYYYNMVFNRFGVKIGSFLRVFASETSVTKPSLEQIRVIAVSTLKTIENCESFEVDEAFIQDCIEIIKMRPKINDKRYRIQSAEKIVQAVNPNKQFMLYRSMNNGHCVTSAIALKLFGDNKFHSIVRLLICFAMKNKPDFDLSDIKTFARISYCPTNPSEGTNGYHLMAFGERLHIHIYNHFLKTDGEQMPHISYEFPDPIASVDIVWSRGVAGWHCYLVEFN